jgi:hypothetical protein
MAVRCLKICSLALLAVVSTGCVSSAKNGLDAVLAPSNNREWTPNHAVLPRAEFRGSQVTVRNIRNSRYLTDYDYVAQHYDDQFDLGELDSVDFIMTPFKEAPALAHTMLSFGFRDGRQVVVSAEARLERGEKYHPLNGAMRQYELMYVVGDERDLLPLRTKHRDVDVYVYRSTASPTRVRSLFHDVMNRVNQLEKRPEFYDTITNNCTSNIVFHINRLQPGRIPLDMRALLPGYSDELAYELGLIERHGDFQNTRQVARVTELANAHLGDPAFSARIRRR